MNSSSYSRNILTSSNCPNVYLRQRKSKFLGFQVGYGVASIDQSKMDGLHNWPRTLSTVKEIRQVLGVLGYQRPFIQNFAEIARPLTQLTKKGIPFEWTQECRDTLDQLIAKVTEDPKIIACYEPSFSFHLLYCSD